ncbi:MAG: polysaccharide-degrading enzyme [Deltaproteobacteria bacterium]|nr:polysaccharide-degrading enzyme [Deltaproteobacteria bacterium]
MITALGVVLVSSVVSASAYEVGPGKTFANIGDVAWEALSAGDAVLIHWRAEPYREKWVIGVHGEAAKPITVRGVLGPGGERPVVDGRDATTRSSLNFWNEERGVIKVGGANSPDSESASHIVIENIEVRSGRQPYSFTGRNGLSDYAKNTAAIFVEWGEHVTIRNCVMRDSGNGLFVSAASKGILIEGNHIFDNGNAGSAYEHNSYTAAAGITFQFNRYGPLCAGCDGNNLKDRSAGLVVRYNWIEGGNRELDLVDAEDSQDLVNDPRYHKTFVYGNVLVEPDGAGNSQIVHYGGDSGTESDYRKGALYFYNNTVVSTRSGNTTLLRLSTNDERADVRNNVIHVAAAGNRLGLVDETGVVDLTHNWLKPGYVESHGGLAGTINDDGTSVTGVSPGFEDEVGQEFRLAPGSACINKGTALHPAVLPDHDVVFQYVKHQASEQRPVDGPLDLGAFEYCAEACGEVDGGTATDGGSAHADGAAADAPATDDGPPQDAANPTDAAGLPDVYDPPDRSDPSDRSDPPDASGVADVPVAADAGTPPADAALPDASSGGPQGGDTPGGEASSGCSCASVSP